MRLGEARELAASLRRSRPAVTYFRHRYAAWLLGRAAGEGTPARVLKRSAWSPLLQNDLVRGVAARAGDGVLTRGALEGTAARAAERYPVGLTTWGPGRRDPPNREWFQTSREGTNLVVLLEFPSRHDAVYRRLLDPERRLPLVDRRHPHSRAPRITLAWARIDLDLAAGEALVEEVQSDWMREHAWIWRMAADDECEASRDDAVRYWFRNPAARFAHFERYWQRILAHHRTWWAEATLFAALWVLVEALQIRRIWYHTPEGGVLRKRITWSAPPRSLYSALPERFGFELTSEPPRFLPPPRRERGVRPTPEPPWYRLAL
jgi:hypothetical protein